MPGPAPAPGRTTRSATSWATSGEPTSVLTKKNASRSSGSSPSGSARAPTADENAVIEPIWRDLAVTANLPGYRYVVRVVDSDELNAYACGGHLVVVTTFALEELGDVRRETQQHVGNEDRRSPDEGSGVQLERRLVEVQRREVDHAIAGGESVRLGSRSRVGERAVVRVDDALGASRGTARVQNEERVLRVHHLG